MKQRELKQRIAAAARARGLPWTKVREGGQPNSGDAGRRVVTIPRHREINEHTAEGIFRDLAAELGEGWWRK